MHLLPAQLPWFIAGPAIGLLIVGLYAVANQPLGASGAYVQTLQWARGGTVTQGWRIAYFVGIVVGGLLAMVLRGMPPLGLQYGALGHALPLGALVPLLFAGGTAMGYGARWMGGCTSGHGLCGTAVLSPASFVAAGTFMGTAVIVTFALHVLSGGAV